MEKLQEILITVIMGLLILMLLICLCGLTAALIGTLGALQ